MKPNKLLNHYYFLYYYIYYYYSVTYTVAILSAAFLKTSHFTLIGQLVYYYLIFPDTFQYKPLQ